MEITEEVFDFWAERDLEIDKLIRVGSRAHQLSPNVIREAAVYVYENRHTRYKDDWINAWKVYEIAKHFDAKTIDASTRKRELNLGEQYKYNKAELRKLRARLKAGTLRYRFWAWFDKWHRLPRWE